LVSLGLAGCAADTDPDPVDQNAPADPAADKKADDKATKSEKPKSS
jgi:hypothetical protein